METKLELILENIEAAVIEKIEAGQLEEMSVTELMRIHRDLIPYVREKAGNQPHETQEEPLDLSNLTDDELEELTKLSVKASEGS